MVKAMIKISDKSNQIINIVKVRHNLNNKSQAIDYIAMEYAETILEPELRPEFIHKMKQISKEKSIHITDFEKRYGLK